jgi:sec-independent protein translocase protein TatC
MGDDPEPRGSRSDETDSTADADSESTAAAPTDPSPDPASDDDTDDTDDTVDDDATVDDETTEQTSEAAVDDGTVADTDAGMDAKTDAETAPDVEADADGDEINWTTFAAGEREEDGMPKPTPPVVAGDDAAERDDTDAAERDGTDDFAFEPPQSTDGETDTDIDSETGDSTEAGDAGADSRDADDSDPVNDDPAGFDFEFEDLESDGSETDVAGDGETDADADPGVVDARGDDTETGEVDTDVTSTSTDAETATAGSESGASVLESPDLDERPAEDARDAPATSAEMAEEAPTYDPTLADEDDFFDGPESDVEMPLADHIEEMVRRLGIVFLLAGVVAVVVFPIADDLVNFLWNTHIPGATTIESRRPRLYGPLELILTELKVAGLAGFVVGLPVFVYQTYRFMRPGLYPKERKYYLAAVPTSLVLAFVGVAFAHFVVLPAIFAYFTSYTIGTAVIAFGLKETFGLILVLMGYMALVFQIPLFIMLAIMMGLVTRTWLTEKRLLFWGGFLGVSFLVSPDPTGMAPIIIAATMIVLFEGTLLLLKWTGR